MALQLQNLLYEVRTGAAHITINRPPLNILDTAAIQEMQQALDAVAADSSIDLIVWSGAGTRAFSTGVEIRDHTPERAPAMLAAFHRLFLTLLQNQCLTPRSN